MVVAGLPEWERDLLFKQIRFKEGKLPFKYLCVPITSGRLSSSDCQLVVDKIMAKIHVWGTKNLSYAGKNVLINSVLIGIFGFWASNFILPKEVTQKVEAAYRDFFWRKSTRKPLVAWQAIEAERLNGRGDPGGKWSQNANGRYTVKSEYLWQLQYSQKEEWSRWVWDRAVMPKHAIIA
ncbi:hypothetical protein Cgig2_021649 [Carnegiea gigantea]|uniref:Reverse transcriptase n=1 Tax=Carnegiea gigantea TaxID=171969 RepID=A0A9Q1KB55_9CARY|nr:hypothetical protein Cgig2_021649 [Carnegiea gigantea]